MKKWVIWILAAVCLWSACGVEGTEEGFWEGERINQVSFRVGGIYVDASEGLQEWKTGTKVTDAAQQLLKEKYGQDFCCEQYLYYEEFSLLMKLEAYPTDNPELRFALDVQGRDSRILLWWDNYYNELYREEIEKYVYPAVEPYGIRPQQFFLDIYSMVTTPEISERTFNLKTMGVYFSVPEKEAEKLQAVMPEVIRQIYDKTRSEADFWVYVCQEGMTGAKDFDALQVWKSYDVKYVPESFSEGEEPGEALEVHCHGKQGEKAELWTISVSDDKTP